jgi:VIT1/CCC1 family predicted Fe2+/Mn2+ transporter
MSLIINNNTKYVFESEFIRFQLRIRNRVHFFPNIISSDTQFIPVLDFIPASLLPLLPSNINHKYHYYYYPLSVHIACVFVLISQLSVRTFASFFHKIVRACRHL